MTTALKKTPAGYTYGDYLIRHPSALESYGSTGKGWVVEYKGVAITHRSKLSDATAEADRHARGFWWSRAEVFATALDDLADSLTDEEIKAAVIQLTAHHEITSGDFIELDERPGQFHINGRSYTSSGSSWHRRLRITRNDPNAPLFESMKR